MQRVRLAVILVVGILWSACGGAEEISPPPPPLRPKPVDVDKPRHSSAKDDCEVADPADDDPAKTFQQRSIPEAEKLAQQGVANLKAAATQEVDQQTRESLVTDAVDLFITALLADPYNVTATYYLAAAYGRIGRVQCSINLLKRLLQMRDHASRKDAVAEKLDMLLGRNRQALDPDFNDMRDDVRFRSLIEKMCERDKDKDCVYGEGGTRLP
jgi:hypothetical protein